MYRIIISCSTISGRPLYIFGEQHNPQITVIRNCAQFFNKFITNNKNHNKCK